MKTIKALYPINGYEYKDLSEDAQYTARSEQAAFLLDMANMEDRESTHPDILTAIEKAEANRTPWFTHEIVMDDCRDYIEELLTINEYFFTDTGELLPITHNTMTDTYTLRIADVEMPVDIA